MLLQVSNISKSFNDDKILDKVSFFLDKGEKAAIVGINGAGKSTLLKIITSGLEADEGEAIFRKDVSFGYLAQQQSDLSDSSNTVFDEVMSVMDEVNALYERMRILEKQMREAEGSQLDSMMNEYDRLHHEYEKENGYAVNSMVTGVLKGLGFSEADFGKEIRTLSGGEKTRVALSRLLLKKPDLIILDEPTNHLDIQAVTWLENYIRNYPGAVLIVAHDRYFLDRTVNKIIELRNGTGSVYKGNYTAYAEKSAARRIEEINLYNKQQKEISHQNAVIEKLRSFNREKSIKRAESREKLLEKMEIISKPVELNDAMKIKIEPSIESGRDVLTVTDLKKSFGDRVLFEDLCLNLQRGSRVAITGPNGTGKTTILKIINDMVTADRGSITLGAKVHIGYYDQEQQLLTDDKTLFEEIQDDYPDLDNTRVRNTLAAFLFTGDDVFKQVKDLSGGERGRLSLAKLMLSNANFLILDEPTNHLDIVSREILENALNNYSGTVLYVSHDRYFINKTCTCVKELYEGRLLSCDGDYDYFLEKRDDLIRALGEQTAASDTSNASASIALQSSRTSSDESSAASGAALDYEAQKALKNAVRKRENQIKKCEEEIEKTESDIALIREQMSDPSLASDFVKLNELSSSLSSLETRLEELMDQWTELSE